MSEYIIYADSACDIDGKILQEWGVTYSNLTYHFQGESKEYANDEIPVPEFYQKMRNGGVAKTAAINFETFKDAFEPILQQGTDIIYLAFSSGLSTTMNSGRIACQELSEKYPDRKLVTIDSLAASSGYGLLVYLLTEQKKAGKSFEEVVKYAEETRLRVAHWFTVDDLVYLKRGGRVSAATALLGGMLNIKPVLHVDNEGHLISMGKVRGRKASIRALAKKYEELAIHIGDEPVFICHGDCIDDANLLVEIMKTEYHVPSVLINYTGPVIGAHSGPGTLALFFLAKER